MIARANEVGAELWFSLLCLIASFGAWRYDGIWSMAPSSWPKGRVRYPDGNVSAPMALGNAFDYALIFNGCVIRP